MVGKRDYGVSQRDFIIAWTTSETLLEVSQKTGMPVEIINARASSYRKAGVRLKKLRRKAKPRLDVESLNRLIEQIQSGNYRVEKSPKKNADKA